MKKALPTLNSLEQFLFEVPPYAPYLVPGGHEDDSLDILEGLYGRTGKTLRVDGYCPLCHKASTFTVNGHHIINNAHWNEVEERYSYDHVSITCVRSEYHVIRYWFSIRKLTIEKVGQHPSLASVARDEVSPYRKFMDDADAKEFHKAIGLAAHGVGVGSFVYLRRVFERLIYKRFEEFKAEEGWNDQDFYSVRMEDKIAFLKGHLPAFLVENRKVYSILSIGIHELEEDVCLTYFEAMKQAIVIILEDDAKTREELARRATFAKAIAAFTPPEKSE